MTGFVAHLPTAVAMAVTMAALGALVAWVRARRRARRARLDVGSTAPLPGDEFGVWTFTGPVLGRRRDSVRVRPGAVAWFDAGHVQPRWEVPACEVVLEVRPPGRLADVTRLALTGPDGRRRVLVARSASRPLGSLDAPSARQAALDTTDFVSAMAEAGAVVATGGLGTAPRMVGRTRTGTQRERS